MYVLQVEWKLKWDQQCNLGLTLIEMIKLEHVSKIYYSKKSKNSINAIRNIDLEIQSGDFIGIIGQSGCGKTTLLNLIGGLVRPTEGRIYHNHCDITALSLDELAVFRNKNTGFVFQSFYIEASDTVFDNVVLPLIIAGVDKKIREQKALQILSEVSLLEKVKEPAGDLSGGQKQRLAIARALINDAPLILADEPTGNLDSVNGAEILELFKALNKKGKTIILVTHNNDYVKYCSKIIRLKDGEIINES